MGEHTLNLYFALSTYTEIPTGAWCEFQGERYTLNQPAKVVKHNSRHFEYTLTMDSEGANLKNYKFRNPNDKTLKFPFTASPRYHIQILVDCLNMIDSGWQVGTTIEANEKLISYNHNNCLEALDMIAKAFETEYEIIGKTIHLHKVEYFKDNPLPLQYGKGKGFKTGVSRTTEQSRITRLYVQGGERNIDRSKYGNKELLLPKSQEYVYEGVTFVSDDKGLSIAIKNAQNNGFINEQSLDLSHIYPSRKGTISAIFEVDRDKHFYDFADTSIPQALNFADLQIKGEKMVIYFESGMLSGREFEISRYEHGSGYNHSTRRFEIVPKEEDGTTMPNDIFKPAIGDQYSVYNMHLPAAYICDDNTKTGASWEMMKEACKYLYENRADLFTFTGDLDGIWAKKRWVNVGGRLKMGGYINFSDNEFQRTPVAIRIVGLKEYVNNPYSPQIELSNKVQGQSFSSEIRKLQNQEVYFGEMNKQTQSLTKRSWRNALETIKQVEEAFPEYTQSIIPATVQTMMALVGNKAGQFAFVANKTNPITVPHTLYFDRNNKQINAGSGWIKHYTIGTTDIKPSHSAADYKYWYVSSFVSGRLDDKAKSYYLYIKANKAIETAEFVLSETKIGMEQEAGYYHFLYATVNSEYDGERGIAQFNGFTEITGGQMVTNRIASGNGQQFIALYDDRIEINAHLQISDSNKLEFKQLVNPDLQSLENRLKQYSNEQTNNIRVGGRNLILNSKEERYKEYKGISEDYIIYQLAGGTLEKNTTYTLTLEYKSQDLRGVDLFFIANDYSQAPNKSVPNTNGEWKKESFTFTTNDKSPKGYIRIDNNGSDLGNVTSKLWVRFVKLEKGNISTDWSPAPEDLESLIQKEQQAREQAIAIAKNANEAYARAQSELTKAQAIAEANRRAGIALTAEQQARILQLQLNLQQAKTFAQQKVNELDIGGRNLILNSKNERYKEYRGMVEDYIYYDIVGGTLEKNTTYTLSLEYKSENVRSVEMFFINENTSFVRNRDIPNTNGEWRREIMTFTTDPNLTPRGHIRIDNNGSDLGNVTSKLWVRNIKLERGNKPTDWSPAPEDVENQIANINSDLEIIRQNAARIEALENQNKANTDQRIGKLNQKTAFLDDTQIAGNVVATGTMIVGNTLGTQAGITGVGNATNEVRFWAGSEFGGRYDAPFMVLQDGTVYATKANISGEVNATSGSFTGQINATSGLIGGFTINSDYIGKKYNFYDLHDDYGCFMDIGGMCVWKRQYSREYDMKVLEFTTYGYYFIGFWVYPAGKNTPIKHRIIYRDSNKDQEYIYPSH
ncbi:cell envelope integrity protein TolA [Capnocytophaga sp. CM59]|uniref:cell envelope integrity protein TolA n=1 Tax=Capnocytophaga sp. CM59 TaxID=936370 RepID=UPI00027C64EA|nr:fibronectin type III domain protein [Capnocytophaga sp. CM59]